MSIQGPFQDSYLIEQLFLTVASQGESLSLEGIPLDQLEAALPYLSPTDKKLIEEIAAMMPPQNIPPFILNQIFQDPDAAFGLSRLAGIAGTGALGVSESSLLLACLVSWMQHNEEEKALILEEIGKDNVNPINSALANFIKNPSNSVDNELLKSIQFFKSSPILTAVLKLADQNLVAKAYKLAQQEAVLHFLDKLIENEKARADAARLDEQQRIATEIPPAVKILENYVQDVRAGKIDFSPIVVSTLIVGVLTAAPVMLTEAVGGSAPITMSTLSETLSTVMPPGFAQDLALFGASYIQAAAYWTIPVVLSMFGKDVQTEGKAVDEQTIRAYSLALIAFLENPENEAVLASVLVNRSGEPMTPEKLRSYIAILKITLYANLLAAFERLELGQFTGLEFLNLFTSGTIPYSEADIRYGILKQILYHKEELTPEQYKKLQECLESFIDSAPPLSVLIDPAKAFLALCNPKFYLENTSSQSV